MSRQKRRKGGQAPLLLGRGVVAVTRELQAVVGRQLRHHDVQRATKAGAPADAGSGRTGSVCARREQRAPLRCGEGDSCVDAAATVAATTTIAAAGKHVACGLEPRCCSWCELSTLAVDTGCILAPEPSPSCAERSSLARGGVLYSLPTLPDVCST